MKRWLPHPLMALGLLATWLLLQGSLAAADVLIGVVLALVLARTWHTLAPPKVRPRRPRLMLMLLGRVVLDILRSNLAVAKLILGRRPHRSGFVRIPLELVNPYALATLACIITSTPGTIWVSHDSRRRLLVIHVLDFDNEAHWIASIKQRYETPLLEIFQ